MSRQPNLAKLAPHPAVPLEGYGWAKVGQLGDWGAFLVSGTAAQLQALDDLPDVVGICSMTSGGVRWVDADLDNVILPNLRTKLNTWLAARGYAQIPADWTNRQVIVAVFQKFRANFDFATDLTWVQDI